MEFTRENVKAMPPGAVYKDSVVKGLQLRRRANVWSWQLYYRFDGRERRPKLGDWPSLGLVEARTAARAQLALIGAGVDISAARVERRALPTVAELCQLFSDSLARRVEAGAMKARTVEEYRRHMRLHIPKPMQLMLTTDVTRAHVSAILDKIAADHPTNANRVRATLSAMFKFAEREGYRPQRSSPVFGTMQRREHKRRRYATPNEMVGLSTALASLQREYPAHVAAILVILYAGTRVTELVRARHSQMQGTRLILREHKTERTGHDRVIYLPLPARVLIEQLPVDGSDYLFGAYLATQKEPRYSVQRIWDMARQLAGGCPDLRVQDLRRTFASVAASQGASLKQIGDVFGHGDADTTQHYAFFMEEPARALVEATGASLAKMLPALPPPTSGRDSGGNR